MSVTQAGELRGLIEKLNSQWQTRRSLLPQHYVVWDWRLYITQWRPMVCMAYLRLSLVRISLPKRIIVPPVKRRARRAGEAIRCALWTARLTLQIGNSNIACWNGQLYFTSKLVDVSRFPRLSPHAAKHHQNARSGLAMNCVQHSPHLPAILSNEKFAVFALTFEWRMHYC